MATVDMNQFCLTEAKFNDPTTCEQFLELHDYYYDDVFINQTKMAICFPETYEETRIYNIDVNNCNTECFILSEEFSFMHDFEEKDSHMYRPTPTWFLKISGMYCIIKKSNCKRNYLIIGKYHDRIYNILYGMALNQLIHLFGYVLK